MRTQLMKLLPGMARLLTAAIFIACGLALFAQTLAASPCSDCNTKYAQKTAACKANAKTCKSNARAARDEGYRRCEQSNQSEIGIRSCKASYRMLYERDRGGCLLRRAVCLMDAKAGKTACKIANCSTSSSCCGIPSPALCASAGHTWSYSKNCCTH